MNYHLANYKLILIILNKAITILLVRILHQKFYNKLVIKNNLLNQLNYHIEVINSLNN